MHDLTDKHLSLQQLIGEQLSSVTFVMDYFQLHFDGPFINVTSDLTTVRLGSEISKSWDDRFRNMLCGQIQKIVRSVRIIEDQSLTIKFEEDSEIIVSLKPEDQSGPEAIYYAGFEDNGWGVL